MPSLTLEINPESPKTKFWLDAIRARHKLSREKMQNFHKKWKDSEEKFVAYMPEREADAARRNNRELGGKPDYTTIVLPYSYAVLMTSHTYWTTVFLSRSPVFQYTGRHGEGEHKVQALEALIDYQLQVGEMLVPLYIWLMDTGKYGLGVIGEYWDTQFAQVSEIVEEDEVLAGFIPTGRTKKIKRTRRIPGYQGNKLYNVRPADFFPDPRVPVGNFQKGEFCGVYKELGWNEILRRAELGYYTNLEQLRKEFKIGGSEDREAGSGQLLLPEISTLFHHETDIKSVIPKALYEYYIELIPNDWGLGKSKLPEKWVFTCDTNFKVLIGATPLGAIHDKFPFDVMEFEVEGYALANRSSSEILKPIQNTMDWLVNSHFYNVRKALNDQFIVDPSRVTMADLLDPLPGNLIRMKPRGYGQDPASAIKQLQVVDVTRGHMGDLNTMFQIGQRVSGVSDQIMGMLNQGGRRTAQEVRTSSTFGVNRLKTQSEYFGAMGWSPMSQKLVQNSQQYYDGEFQVRIVGDLLLEAGKEFLEVTPESIQGFYDFVPVDGNQPIDRFAQANLWRELFAQMRNFPEIMAQYDTGRIFAWVAQLAGLKNINKFKIEVQPDLTAGLEADRGNLIKLGNPGGANVERTGGRSASDLGRISEPGQVSGLGTTG